MKDRAVWLINPRRKKRFQWDLREVCALMGKKTAAVPLALPLVAALTPERYAIRIIDEEIEPLDLDGLIYERSRDLPDVVGITAWHSNITRGFEVADAFRRRGVPVVMGGPEVSFDTERALEHCDALVIGEAEGAWERCLEDLERGRLERTYRAPALCEFRTSPRPRWDLVDTDQIMMVGVQVSRGCPNRCRFCCVSKLFGKEQRYRDVDDVVAEVAAAPVKEIAFADDNLFADRDYARELLEKIAPLGVSWSCQSSLDVGLEPDMLELMARAGCNMVLFGFESVSAASLREAEKKADVVERYDEIVENVHRAGVHILASFLVGFDGDRLETFDRIEEFVRRNRLSFVMINSLSPFKGTALYRSLERQGRLVPMVIDELSLFYPMMKYRHMRPDDLAVRGLETLRRIYSYSSLREKGPAVLGNGAFDHEVRVPVPLGAKLRSSLSLLRSHVLTGDRDKRALFAELLSLIRAGRAAPADVVRYLLFMEAQNGFLDDVSAGFEASLAHIRRQMALAGV